MKEKKWYRQLVVMV